ncbi:MAG: His-Xaa-Ser system radical SAM maturase HxsB [Candidatus Omnitrophica bacterium]|nr:His-Xaa-Ser system radical SAM maturase HxsB [Candidatus Omnitrophota bacterium]
MSCSSKQRAGAPRAPQTPKTGGAGFFRFKKAGREYLVTNDIGRFCRLSSRDFKGLVSGTLDPRGRLYNELAENFFVRDRLDAARAAGAYRQRYEYIAGSPTLHIVVATLRCNYACVYCQANRRGPDASRYDMTEETARRAVDTIFQCPSRGMTIEFQGGEPLLNWPVVKFIIEYAREKNSIEKRNLRIALVTNLSLMTDAIYEFLIKQNVSLCTSFDGPEDIHNRNRPFPGGNSYAVTTGWIKTIRAREKEAASRGEPVRQLNALLTITRSALSRLRQIIDEYLALGFTTISLRKLSYLGLSGGRARDAIGYTAEEFIAAWKDALEYIIQLNARGVPLCERTTVIFLQKILTPHDPHFLDLRSPCGAGVGQLAYSYDGKVYACDEARTLEDETFLLGDVAQGGYRQIASCPKIKTLLLCSTLENFSCDECVYKPYCGTCPVVNFAHHGTVFPHIRSTDNCKVNMAMLDFIFEKLRDRATEEIFKRWAGQS